MVFWRKKKNEGDHDRAAADDRLIHPQKEPDLAPQIERDNPALDSEFIKHELAETESEIIEEMGVLPTPDHTPVDDAKERAELSDHTAEGGWLSRLSAGLSKSTNRLGQGISDIFTKRKLDAQSLQDLEDLLISADLGPKTAAQVIADFSARKFDKDVDSKTIRLALAEIMGGMLAPVSKPLEITKPQDGGPFVLLVCGVNGAGKTTTIGKLAYQWHVREHRKVMIAAADTFRAAAIDQLEVWAKRAHAPLFKKDIGADAAAVAFEAYEKAKSEGADVLIIDTAGRLQNKANLMDELGKIVRVLKKQGADLPHACVLVLDATTGQNAHAQVQVFRDAVEVSGLMVTKLDGSARGGVVIALAREFGLPIHAVGVGEGIEDLSPFRADDFARALLGVGV